MLKYLLILLSGFLHTASQEGEAHVPSKFFQDTVVLNVSDVSPGGWLVVWQSDQFATSGARSQIEVATVAEPDGLTRTRCNWSGPPSWGTVGGLCYIPDVDQDGVLIRMRLRSYDNGADARSRNGQLWALNASQDVIAGNVSYWAPVDTHTGFNTPTTRTIDPAEGWVDISEAVNLALNCNESALFLASLSPNPLNMSHSIEMRTQVRLNGGPWITEWFETYGNDAQLHKFAWPSLLHSQSITIPADGVVEYKLQARAIGERARVRRPAVAIVNESWLQANK